MKYCSLCKASYEDQSLVLCPSDKTFLIKDEWIGQTIGGDLFIEARLGHGGMGIVYLAHHLNIGDKVAIKLLKPELVLDAKILDRFRREALAGRSFSHPNAVHIYDLKFANGVFYIVMEYAPGQPLSTQLAGRRRFDLAEACSILEPIGSALIAAHEMGIIHRDVKPENIVITVSPAGKFLVKLLDFGIAKLREVLELSSLEKAALTAANEIIGTPRYMPPEQARWPQRDGLTEIDARVDIYSLALVYYETIGGRHPFDGPSRLESTAITPLHELIPGIPIAFSLAIQRALSWDREDRQKCLADFMNELKEARNLSDGGPNQIALDFNPSSSDSGAATDVSAPRVSTLDQEKPTLPMRKEVKISQRVITSRNTSYSIEVQGNTIVIRGLVDGESFYPLRFLRENLSESDLNLIFSGPFRSLFQPRVCRGLTKWISLRIEKDGAIVQSYPKPILRDENDEIKQPNQLVVNRVPVQFEYWPDGDHEAAIFTIEVQLGKALLMVLSERNRHASRLALELHYTKKAA
jgi:serine/threonine protein kinase